MRPSTSRQFFLHVLRALTFCPRAPHPPPRQNWHTARCAGATGTSWAMSSATKKRIMLELKLVCNGKWDEQLVAISVPDSTDIFSLSGVIVCPTEAPNGKYQSVGRRSMCRDGTSEISRDPRTKRLQTRRESLAMPSKHTNNNF